MSIDLPPCPGDRQFKTVTEIAAEADTHPDRVRRLLRDHRALLPPLGRVGRSIVLSPDTADRAVRLLRELDRRQRPLADALAG